MDSGDGREKEEMRKGEEEREWERERARNMLRKPEAEVLAD